MSTATIDMPPIHESEAVASASEKLGAARRKVDVAAERVRLAQMTMADGEAERVAQLDAQMALPRLQADLLKAEREARAVEELVREAYVLERERRRKELAPGFRKEVAALRDALLAASAVSERVKAAQFGMHEASGEPGMPFDPVGWPELTPGDDGRLGLFLARIGREFGL